MVASSNQWSETYSLAPLTIDVVLSNVCLETLCELFFKTAPTIRHGRHMARYQIHLIIIIIKNFELLSYCDSCCPLLVTSLFLKLLCELFDFQCHPFSVALFNNITSSCHLVKFVCCAQTPRWVSPYTILFCVRLQVYKWLAFTVCLDSLLKLTG